MPFQIVRNDITRVKADVIVNTANPNPVIGSGTDSAIYLAAGEEQLLAERIRIGKISPGQAAVTPAFGLPAKYIIHTVGPVWIDGEHGERDVLRSCYEKSLAKADELKAESIAFPLIATGVYGFPKDEALQIALAEIGKFLLAHDMKVILVVFDRKAFELSGKLVSDINEFIDDHEVGTLKAAEYGYGDHIRDRRRRELTNIRADEEIRPRRTDAADEEVSFFGATLSPISKPLMEPGESLEDVLQNTGNTFQQKLFELIDASGMDDVTVYKKANIDRKVFSRIRCKKDYRPKKKTAVAFAIALHLDMPTMLDLLARAEIAFSPSSKFDLIITYFVTHGIYDIFEINAALFQYGQPILGE